MTVFIVSVIEQAALVSLAARRLAGCSLDRFHRFGEHRVVDVANGHNLGMRARGEHPGMIRSAVAQADDGNANALAGRRTARAGRQPGTAPPRPRR